MSRYGPQVLPSGVNPLAVALDRLSQGWMTGVDRARTSEDRTIAASERERAHQREDVADTRAADAFTEGEYEHGFRRGEAPISPALQQVYASMGGFEGSGQPGDPIRAGRGALPDVGLTPSTPTPRAPTPGVRSGTGASTGIDTEALAEMFRDGMVRPVKPPTPGSYVEGQGFHGVTTPRFEQVRPDLYYDRDQSPAGERRADRDAQLRAAADYRRGDIRARGDEAKDLERLRQSGRMAVRDKINAAGATNIMLREQQRAERGGAAMTSGQREANAMKSADGIIGASNGNYDDAIDWLTNTPEGQAAAKAGLEPRHLYSALGKYIGQTTAAATRLQTGPAGLEPGESTAAVATTRNKVSAGTRSPKRAITQAQYDQARAAGHDDATIARSYTIPTSVKRKR